MRFASVYLAIALCLFSCRKDVGSAERGGYPLAIGKIITENCSVSGCHNSKSFEAASGLNLETWESMFRGSNSGSSVVPFNSRFSPLCYFINTYPDLGSQNTPVMPLNKPSLSYDQVKSIKDWIDGGAPDIKGNVMWADNPQRKKFYAVNQGCDVVTVFDAETQLPMRYIEVGRPGVQDVPHQIRVSPDGKYWYVVFVRYNFMQKYNCSDDSFVANIPMSPLAAGTGVTDAFDWNTMIITKDSKMAYCVSWTLAGKVAAIDLENHRLVHFLVIPNYPHAVALSADEKFVYVGQQQGNYFSKIDTSFSSIVDYSIQNGLPPNQGSSLDIHDILLSPLNPDELIITCQTSNEVRIFNTSSYTTTAVINVGVYPQEVIYSPVNGQFYVSCTYDSTASSGSVGVLTRINAYNYNDVQKIQIGYQPHGMAIDEKKKIMYVLSRNQGGLVQHHTSQCAGKNGFVNFMSLVDHKIQNRKYELSVDPYYIFARP